MKKYKKIFKYFRKNTALFDMSSKFFDTHQGRTKKVVRAGTRLKSWGFQRDMAGYYLNSSVVFKFWVANQTIVMAKKKRRKKNYP